MKKRLIGLLLAGVTISMSVSAAEPLKIGFANRTLNGAFFNGLTEYRNNFV